MKGKSYRRVEIQPVLNGFIVTVGCSQVVFTDEVAFIEAFTKWIKDPQGTEKEFQANSIRSGAEVAGIAAEGPPEIIRRERVEEPQSNDCEIRSR